MRIIITLLLLLIPSAREVSAQGAPKLINYQGRLTEASGRPIPDGAYGIAVRIWSSAARTSEDHLIWGQEYTNVPLVNGAFNMILGNGVKLSPENPTETDLANAFNDTNRFFGITITKGTNGLPIAGATEILPRQQILSVPFALRAQQVVESPVPRGLISMWSGSISSIPAGWALCDGANGTPDLRDRFIVGARMDEGGIAMTTVKPGTPTRIGGSHEVTLTVDQIPPHSHSYKETPWTGSTYDGHTSRLMTEQRDSTTGVTGGGQAHENCPPFFALAFIMKL